ncbi:stalk domain-containing protein [Tumebacillus sp. DT12]|uniref:Stalk domain-containing protein n=1 Tax=Tumebacillus lacus TaxID=2995335 RepID=A0ABT3WXV0_9BACL|nr:stalk domain-containing protein [Tumebacillus lacus]MCX7569503.1 stalk domain-containing protein [Tumebacillus lacus]
MRGFKRIVGRALTVALVASMIVSAQSESAWAGTPQRPDIYVDGQRLFFDVQPQLVQDRTLAPVRMILEGLGAEVTWEAATRTAVAKKDGVTLRMPIGERRVTKNGQPVMLDVPAKLIENRTMVPVRFIAEAFGDRVTWGGGQGRVDIQSGQASKMRIVGADSAVKDGSSVAVWQLLQQKSVISRLETSLGLTFQEPVWLFLAGNDAGYQAALKNYAEDPDAADTAQHADGLAVGSKIVLPLHRHLSVEDQVMTVAHELTHVLLNQNGGDEIPSWIHEGVAWDAGLDVRYAGQPALLRESIEGVMRQDVLKALQNRTYLDLIDSSASKLRALGTATYNVESQDYLAVRELVERSGEDALRRYLRQFGAGAATPFQGAFGMTSLDFKGQFRQGLEAELARVSRGTEITLRVSGAFQGRFSVLPAGSSTWQTFTLPAGDHTVRVYRDGRVEGVQLTGQLTETQPDPETIYLFLEPNAPMTEAGQLADGGGLAIADVFGSSSYQNAWLFTTDGKTLYPDTHRLFGVELVRIQTIL